MNPAHLHLMLNHLPVIGTAFTLLLLVVAQLRKSNELKRVSLFFFVLLTFLAVPAYLTGEPAEELVEKLGGVSRPFMEEHEQAAQWAFGAHVALGITALLGLALTRRGRPLPNWFAVPLFLLALLVCGVMVRTANLGGQIRHPEIRATPPGGPPRHQKDKD